MTSSPAVSASAHRLPALVLAGALLLATLTPGTPRAASTDASGVGGGAPAGAVTDANSRQASGASANGAGGPALAVEDTLHTEVSEVLVRAPRVTLDEILDRVERGEARRDSLLHDQSFTATMRVMRNTVGRKTPELFFESVSRVYKKKPKYLRAIELRKYEREPDKDDGSDTVDSDFSPDMGEELVNFAFRPGNRRNFRFVIEDRKLLGDHLLYTLRFEPRSALAVYEPSGRVWVDTKDFVIVRQELEFRQSPVPLFLKGIRHLVIERTHADGFWVLSRMLVRVELTVPVPKFGRAFDFAMAMSDYKVNSGLPDSMFAAPRDGKHAAHVRVKVGGGRGRKS